MTKPNDEKRSSLVSVVVPTRDRFDVLRRCIESIYSSDYEPLELIVVDDASEDGSQQRIQELFPKAKVVRNEKRMLLAASRNRGLSLSSGDYIMFVDDDNILDKSAILKLVEGIELTQAGVVAPIIYYATEPTKIWYAGSWMGPLSAIGVFPYRGLSGLRFRAPFPTALFHDAFMMRRSVFESVGEFDPKGFPVYLSEADYAERIKRNKISVFVIPTASVWHDVPVLKGVHNLLRHTHITEPVRAYYVARNRIIFMKRYRGVLQQFLFFSFFVPAIGLLHLLAILSSRHYSRIHLIRFYLGGLIAGFRA